MSDLISRSVLIEEIVEDANTRLLGFDGGVSLGDMKEWVELQPTVDAVPVVRCKDCKHWGCGLPMETDHAKCCSVGGYMVGENGYCCYGEKKK